MAITMIQAGIQVGKHGEGFAELITNTSVLAKLFHFITSKTLTYEYPEVAALGGIYYRSINEVYPSGDYSVVNPKTERLSVFGGEVRTDARLIAQDGNARQNEIARRIQRSGLFYDYEVIHGEGHLNQKSMVGLKYRLAGKQVLQAGVNGATLTLTMVDDLIDSVLGPNSKKVLLMNKVCRRKLKQLVVGAAGGAAVSDVGGTIDAYDGVKVHVLDEDGDDRPILEFNETQGSEDETTSIYCLAPGGTTDREGIQGLAQEGLFKVGGGVDWGEYTRDVVESGLGFALFHPRAAARLKGITKG